jgi:hypothetical protein
MGASLKSRRHVCRRAAGLVTAVLIPLLAPIAVCVVGDNRLGGCHLRHHGALRRAGQMRFAINVDAAEGSGLHLSSRLLGLAQIIRTTHDH